MALYLRTVTKLLNMTRLRMVHPLEIDRAVTKYWRLRHRQDYGFTGLSASKFTKRVAMQFLRFHHRLKRAGPTQPFGEQLRTFAEFLEKEPLGPATIQTYRGKVAVLLRCYATQKRALRLLSDRDLNKYIAVKKAEGQATASLVHTAQAMRAFFRYGEKQGWYARGMAERVYVRCASHSIVVQSWSGHAEADSCAGGVHGSNRPSID